MKKKKELGLSWLLYNHKINLIKKNDDHYFDPVETVIEKTKTGHKGKAGEIILVIVLLLVSILAFSFVFI